MTTTSTPQHAPDDQDVRDALSALRGATPEARDLSALRRRLHTAAPPRRSVRRPVVAVAAATAAIGVGVAVLPGGDDSGSGTFGGLGTPSALASEVPPVRDGPYRYARTRTRLTYVIVRGGRTATLREDKTDETWVGPRWTGRTRTAYGRDSSTGDEALARSIGKGSPREGSVRDGPFEYGEGPLATLDPADLPAGRDAIGMAIREGIRTNRWARANEGRGVPRSGADRRSEDAFVDYEMITLLVNARLTADQRAAFLDVLRSDPNATSRGTGTDAEGRAGQVVDLDYRGAQSLLGVKGFRVVYDPGSDEILEWSTIPTPPTDDQPNMANTETVLRSAYVDSTTDRP